MSEVAGAVLLVFAADVRASAQSAPAPGVKRHDASAYLGHSQVREPSAAEFYDDRYGVANGTLALGWYWTEHVKTEVEGTWASEGHLAGSVLTTVPGVSTPALLSTRNAYRTRTLTIAQSYQFFHNAWFHPFVSAGLDLGWRRERAEIPEQNYYPGSPFGPFAPPIVVPARSVRTTTDLVPQAFGGGGFKAYLTPRAFFRADGRFGAGPHTRTHTVRFGFGFDF